MTGVNDKVRRYYNIDEAPAISGINMWEQAAKRRAKKLLEDNPQNLPADAFADDDPEAVKDDHKPYHPISNDIYLRG